MLRNARRVRAEQARDTQREAAQIVSRVPVIAEALEQAGFTLD